MDPFAQFYRNAERLVRRRRAWRWGGQGAVAGLTLTLLYLVAAIPGWMPTPGLLWLLAFNALVAAGAALGGYRAPVDMDGVLFQIDQTLKTGELLLTLHDLKARGEAEFSAMLERRMQTYDIRPERAFYHTGYHWKRGGTIAALALGCGVLLLGLNTTWAGFGLGGAGSPSLAGAGSAAALPGELQAQLEEVKRVIPNLPDDLSEQVTERLLSSRPNFRQMVTDLGSAQDQVLGLSGTAPPNASEGDGEGQTDDGSTEEEAERRREQQRQNLEALQQQLQSLQAQLGQNEGEPPDEGALAGIQRAMEGLDEESELRAEMERALEGIERGEPASREALEQLRRELGERLQTDEQLESLRQALARWSDEREADERVASENASEGGDGERSDGSPEGDGSGQNGRDAESDRGNGSAPQEGEREGQSPDPLERAGRGLGEQAGSGEARAGAARPLEPWTPSYKHAKVPDGLIPAEAVARWLGRGVPVESDANADGTPAGYRLSYDQVEALLDVRDLPVEVRDVVRSYFLGIIGQLNEAQ